MKTFAGNDIIIEFKQQQKFWSNQSKFIGLLKKNHACLICMNCALISSKYKCGKFFTLSFTEIEYVDCSEASKEKTHLLRIFLATMSVKVKFQP